MDDPSSFLNDKEMIEHEADVIAVEGKNVKARITQISGCAKCHSKAVCSMSDKSDKVIEPLMQDDIDIKAGDKVIVAIHPSVGMRAVIFAYVVPAVLFLIALLIFSATINNEITCAALALSILLPYYYVLYLQRDRLKKSLNFYIKNKI